MSSPKSIKKGGAAKGAPAPDHPSQVRFAELLKLHGLSASTQEEHRCYIRKLATRGGRDPAGLDEAAVRAHLLHRKDAHHCSPSSMRTTVAAMRAYHGLHPGREWKLSDLARSPSAQKLPTVLTRAAAQRLFAVVRAARFRTLFRLINACGLRIGEAVNLEVRDLREPGRLHIREAKGNKERCVPLPPLMLAELRAWWKTHRHPRWLFPSVGHGCRDGVSTTAALAHATGPLGVGSVRHCLRLARVPHRAETDPLERGRSGGVSC